ncbi:MAG TPA: permease-like cell division protein FtsX [Candidatus Binatia bacterium]
MSWSHLAFVARRVRQSLWELAWSHVLTSGTMATSLFVFGVFILIQENLQHLLNGWGDQIQINTYLDNDVDLDRLEALMSRVRAMPEVEAFRHISKEQAWMDFQTALGAQSAVLEGLPPDVLPASFEITVKPAYRDPLQIEDLAGRLGKINGIAAVEYPQQWVDRLNLFVLAVQWAKWALGGILFIATFFIVGSTVRLALLARKDEIEIMQFVGASEGLIRAPFVVEGMLQGSVGAGISIFCLWLCYLLLQQYMVDQMGLFGSNMQLRFLDPASIAMIVAIGLLLGGFGSLFSLRRFLKTWRG